MFLYFLLKSILNLSSGYVGHSAGLVGVKFVKLICQIEEWILHPHIVLGRALEVLDLQGVGGVKPGLGGDRATLREVSLVPDDDPRHVLHLAPLPHGLYPGLGRRQALVTRHVKHGQHQ